MGHEIRPLRTEDIVAAARQQAEAGEPMQHHFEPGSRQAAIFEHTYIGRQRELEEVEG